MPEAKLDEQDEKEGQEIKEIAKQQALISKRQVVAQQLHSPRMSSSKP